MRIRILLFATYRDLAGVEEFDMEVAPHCDAAGAVGALRALNERFAALPPRPAVAVNREYAGLDAILRDGDELALIPPVAGG